MNLAEIIKPNKLNKGLLITIGIILFIALFFIYKVFFSNPVGVDHKFYKEQLFVYETIMKAFEEDRQLTSFEQSKTGEVVEFWEKEMQDRANKTTKANYYEFEQMLSITFSISRMERTYIHAMDDWDNDERRKEYIDDFIEAQKIAKADLGIK